ncbi:MAG: sugar ABC transporter ATP-binding protein [Planctomycetota bacterium]
MSVSQSSTTLSDTLLLCMKGIEKRYPGVHALKGIDLDLHAGEVLALLGENGAGKSTLIKILGGAVIPDCGTISVDGNPVSIAGPLDAQRAGIGIIYQEFNLVPALSARENIFLGRERSRLGFVNAGDEHQKALGLFKRIGVEIDPETPCGQLSVAQQQVVEIAKALSQDARIIVMDEPSATLTPQEVERLFVIIRDLKKHGIGVIYISHRLDEIYTIADRAMVMRDGQHIGTRPLVELDRSTLIEMMVGRSIDHEFPRETRTPGNARLVVKNLNRGTRVRDVSFEVRRGEILGITGLVGSGRTETARLIFGADSRESGTITLDGQSLDIRNPSDAIRAGICLLTEDRKSEGLVLKQSVRENFALPNLRRFSSFGFIRDKEESGAFAGYVAQLKIKIPDHEALAQNLSGGNQQKVVLAKWLQRHSEVLIFDEPTRGIDVGAKFEIYLLMNALAASGKAIVMISSELPEVLGMSDRVLVMHEGRIVGEVTDVPAATQQQIMALAVG